MQWNKDHRWEDDYRHENIENIKNEIGSIECNLWFQEIPFEDGWSPTKQ
jgi:hypothetical protein